jgi:hypothetical protein
MKRKSLVDAISPELREFIEAGTPKPQIGEIAPVPTPREKAPGPVGSDFGRVPSPKQRVEEPEPEVAVPLITQSYRLPVALVGTLVRESMERKIARRKPWSQQDIVTEALSEWLQKHASK